MCRNHVLDSHKVEEGLQKLMSQVEEVSVMLSTNLFALRQNFCFSIGLNLTVHNVFLDIPFAIVDFFSSSTVLYLVYSLHEMNEALVQWRTMFSRTLSRLSYSLLCIGFCSCKVLKRSHYVEQVSTQSTQLASLSAWQVHQLARLLADGQRFGADEDS